MVLSWSTSRLIFFTSNFIYLHHNCLMLYHCATINFIHFYLFVLFLSATCGFWYRCIVICCYFLFIFRENWGTIFHNFHSPAKTVWLTDVSGKSTEKTLSDVAKFKIRKSRKLKKNVCIEVKKQKLTFKTYKTGRFLRLQTYQK